MKHSCIFLTIILFSFCTYGQNKLADVVENSSDSTRQNKVYEDSSGYYVVNKVWAGTGYIYKSYMHCDQSGKIINSTPCELLAYGQPNSVVDKIFKVGDKIYGSGVVKDNKEKKSNCFVTLFDLKTLRPSP